MNKLPDAGYLRLIQIIGRPEVTPEQAEKNKLIPGKPKRPCSGIPPIIPVCKSTWWNGIKSGLYPKPVKLGPRTTVWRCEDIRALIAAA